MRDPLSRPPQPAARRRGGDAPSGAGSASPARHLQTDVLIVGAGPAGLATAIGLAMRSVDFLTVDALAEAQNTSRAAVIHAATLAALDELGVAGKLVAQGIQVPHFRIRDRDDVLLHADFSRLPGPWKYTLMIPQNETELILLGRLRALGQDVRRPVRLAELQRGGGGMHARCMDADRTIGIDARLVVGADGGQSTVRERAGIGFPGTTYGSFMLADVRMVWPIDRDEVSLYFSAGGTLVVAPMLDERHRIVAQLSDAPASPVIRDAQRLLDLRRPRRGARVRELLWGRASGSTARSPTGSAMGRCCSWAMPPTSTARRAARA